MTHSTTRRAAAWLAAGFFAVALSATLSSPNPVRAATIAVSVENYDFAPASRTIAVGDVVRWTFSGDQHSVTSRDGLFDSGITTAGGTFQFTFTQAGTYRYYCLVHPGLMSGTIVVTAATATPKPTVRPTAKPTPTPKPTPRSTVRPTATTAPAATPTANPSPSASPSATASAVPSASAVPNASADASQALVATPGPSSVPATPAPTSNEPGRADDVSPMVALGVVLAVVVLGGLFLARRRRAT